MELNSYPLTQHYVSDLLKHLLCLALRNGFHKSQWPLFCRKYPRDPVVFISLRAISSPLLASSPDPNPALDVPYLGCMDLYCPLLQQREPDPASCT